MLPSKTFIVSLALAATALTPAGALARNGLDDSAKAAGDDSGRHAVNTSGGHTTKRVTGKCTDGSTSKLKVKPDNGRLETEFEVDQNRSGVTWKVTIRRNGAVAVKTHARTKAPSGSFSVARRLANSAGSDTIRARATSPSGEVCTASATV